MTKHDILDYFKDINHAYNDCTKYDTLKNMLDELQDPCNEKMQMVINIPKKLACEGFERPFTEEEKNVLIKAIGNGKTLPKGHGRLIDADAVLVEPFGNTYKDIDIAETIIEADRAERSEKK